MQCIILIPFKAQDGSGIRSGNVRFEMEAFLLDINWCQREKTEIWRKFQQAEEKNLPFEPEGPQGQRAQMANFSLRLDGILWILRFFLRTPVDILYISRINSIASRQFGAVSRQYGAVRGQYGAVRGLFSEFSIFFCFYFFSAPYFTAHCSILPAGYLWYQYFHQHTFFLGFIFFQMID